MKLKVMDRWLLVNLLPEKANLATSLIVDDLRRKLLLSAEEQEELGMVIGVVCGECGSPVENRGTEEDPEYYCVVCGDFVDNTKGVEGRTVWNTAADIGKDVEFNKAERGIFIQAFSALDKNDAVEPQHVALWKMLSAAYPESFTRPESEDDG